MSDTEPQTHTVRCRRSITQLMSCQVVALTDTALLGRSEPPFRTGVFFTRDVFFLSFFTQPNLRGRNLGGIAG